MLGTWKVDGGRETRQFSQYTGAVQQSRSLRRNNARRACILCRRKKLKCSGEAGSCDRCSRLGTRCRYPPNVEHSTEQDSTAQIEGSDADRRRRSDSSQHLDASQDTSPYDTARSNMDETDDTSMLSSPKHRAAQLLTDGCGDFDYMVDAAGINGAGSGLLAGIPSTGVSDQVFDNSSAETLVGHPCFTTLAALTCGHPYFTPLSTLTWVSDFPEPTRSSNDGSSSSSGTFEPTIASGLDEGEYFMIHDQISETCECLQTAAHILHELGAHASSGGSAIGSQSLGQHLELFNTSARRLRCIARCTACKFQAENMMVNAMALQQLCSVCEQMPSVAESDLDNMRSSIDIRIGRFQVQLGNEKASICAAIMASQLNIFAELIKDFKLVATSMPTPFALLQAIEDRITELRAAKQA